MSSAATRGGGGGRRRRGRRRRRGVGGLPVVAGRATLELGVDDTAGCGEPAEEEHLLQLAALLGRRLALELGQLGDGEVAALGRLLGGEGGADGGPVGGDGRAFREDRGCLGAGIGDHRGRLVPGVRDDGGRLVPGVVEDGHGPVPGLGERGLDLRDDSLDVVSGPVDEGLLPAQTHVVALLLVVSSIRPCFAAPDQRGSRHGVRRRCRAGSGVQGSGRTPAAAPVADPVDVGSDVPIHARGSHG